MLKELATKRHKIHKRLLCVLCLFVADSLPQVKSYLKREPRNQCPCPRREVYQRCGRGSSRRTGRIDAAESAGCIAVGQICSSRFVIVVVRIAYDRSIKDVRELDSNFQTGAFCKSERTAQTHAFARPALLPVIAVIRGRRPKLAGGRIL